jgi:hypothetical protein
MKFATEQPDGKTTTIRFSPSVRCSVFKIDEITKRKIACLHRKQKVHATKCWKDCMG